MPGGLEGRDHRDPSISDARVTRRFTERSRSDSGRVTRRCFNAGDPNPPIRRMKRAIPSPNFTAAAQTKGEKGRWEA